MLKHLEISGQTGHSNIYVGDSLENTGRYLPKTRVVVITDTNVWHQYRHRFPDAETIVIGTGEAVKSMETVADIYDRLVALEADRSTFLLGIGGGIVCDITGFVASTYLRGVRFGYVATTLLAQVDASVGGKTGVNFRGYKNMVGTFNQPEFVICDPSVLSSLAAADLACGFAEIVKHAAISDSHYFEMLEEKCDQAQALEPPVMAQIIYDSVQIKADIVNRDEREKGQRRKLNFGHTLGHALEKTRGLRHGEAVSIGMVAAAEVSAAKNLLPRRQVERIEELLTRFDLPTRVEMDWQAVIDALGRDKKREADSIYFVLLSGLGCAVIEPIGLLDLAAVLRGQARAD
ncbi:MAG: 3-dehydroquinate synthase [Thermodesulfobacteriota bacterium]